MSDSSSPDSELDAPETDTSVTPDDTLIDAGPPPGPDDGIRAQSGTRLRVVDILGADGTRVPLMFYDTLLGTLCSPSADGDGTVRCFPDTAHDENDPSVVVQPKAYFSDSDCKTANLATHPPSSGVPAACPNEWPAVGVVVPGTSKGICGHTQSDYLRVEPKPGGDVYVSGDAGACSKTSSTEPVAVVTTMPPSSFVAFKRMPGPGTGRLAPALLIGDDGSRYWDGKFIDKTLAVLCRKDATADGEQRCLPDKSWSFYVGTKVGTFSGASCTGTRLVKDEPCDPAPGLTIGNELSGAPHVFKLGAPVSTGTVVHEFDGACNDHSVASDESYRAVGDEILPSGMVPLADAVGGSGRLRFPTRVFEGTTAMVPAFPWFQLVLEDSTLGVPCKRLLAEDGQYRCLPWSGGDFHPGIRYTDAECKNPIVAFDKKPPTKPTYTLERRRAGCSWTNRVYELGPATTAPSALYHFETLDGKGCTGGAFGDVASKQFYSVGAVVPPTSFATTPLAIE